MKMTDKNTAPRLKAPEFNRRLDPALGWSRGDPRRRREYLSATDQSRFSVIGKLESGVSMLQTARINIDKLKARLAEMKAFLEEEGYQSFKAKIPVSVINNFLSDRIARMKMISETASFQGRALLNGKSGVIGEAKGDNVRFVRGSPRALTSDEGGYPLAIERSAFPAILTGTERITYENIRDESLISVSEDGREVRYRVRPDEDPDSLTSGLQRALMDHGMDIGVFKTADGRLLFRHNQLGSQVRFKGMSYHTRLVSSIPGKEKESEPGSDVAGSIASEPARGEGGYLIGEKGNRRTDGLVVHYAGAIEYPGQIVGYVKVQQNGIQMPLDISGAQNEILSLPSLQPELLAAGVSNRSGFISLSSIRASTVFECRDALKLIAWSAAYLDYLQDELRKKESSYVERAVDLLRSSLTRKTAGDEIMALSKEKARSMAGQLKGMLSADMMTQVSKIG